MPQRSCLQCRFLGRKKVRPKAVHLNKLLLGKYIQDWGNSEFSCRYETVTALNSHVAITALNNTNGRRTACKHLGLDAFDMLRTCRVNEAKRRYGHQMAEAVLQLDRRSR
jgi:hypothetical protein